MLKGNNTIKLLAVLAVLVGVFFLVKYTGDKSRSKSFRSALVQIDTAEVTEIRITSPEDSVVLTKSAEGWQVSGKPADNNAVKSLMNNLQTIKPSRIASRSDDQWGDFQVDEHGTRVQVLEGSDMTLDIVLGRFNVEGQRSFYSYVRLSEEPDTYVARDFMKMTIAPKSADYRVDDVLRVEWDSLSSVDFNYPDSAFSMYKINEVWQVNGEPVDSAAFENYKSATRFVTSRNFAENTNAPALYDVIFNLKDGETYQITGYGDDRFNSSYNPVEYWKDPDIPEKVFRGKSYFLKE